MLRQHILKFVVPLFDLLLAPLTLMAALVVKSIRKAGVARTPVSKSIFRWVGVFPVTDHYYEPMFDHRQLRHSLREDRALPGIDWNTEEQLALLDRFVFQDELESYPRHKKADGAFYYDNGNFGAGDAEYLYSIIRLFRPARVVEVGAGFSTLMARNAIARNQSERPGYACRHTCIEPYEMPGLERIAGVDVVRKRVEQSETRLFAELEANDILFIDSSHMIRPQGDVLYECLEVLPTLRPGVLVHFHDIFTPRDYPDEWVIDQVKFWNEQYLLEAFMSFNCGFRIIGALNYLFHRHREQLLERCPILRKTPLLEPGSFWLVRSDS